MKNDRKICIDNAELLKDLFEKVYFNNNTMGKLANVEDLELVINPSDEEYSILEGLEGLECKITNDDIISGVAKFIITRKTDEGVFLKPTALYCIKEDELYSFY